MELRQLEYFIAVCEEMHFTRAAEKIGISQPTLSQQIGALEDELNTPLFDRIGKKIAITEAGLILLEQSKQILRNLQNVKDSILDLQHIRRGALSVGTLPSDLDYRISRMLIDYYHDYPNIHLRVVSSVNIEELVLANEVDIGICNMSFIDDRLVQIPLCQEKYMLVVSEHHPLSERDYIHLEELRHIDTVMYPMGFIGRELIERCCRSRGFQLKTIMETTSVLSLINIVKANIGATIQPLQLIQSMKESTLRCIPFKEDAPTRELVIIYRKDRFLSKAAQAFISRLADHFSAL